MRIRRIALFAAATIVFMAGAARPAGAAPIFQLCLELDTPGSRNHDLYLNLAVQGNAVLVSGMRARDLTDDHGPAFGAVSRTQNQQTTWIMGLTVTYQNGGDYAGPNTENYVFTFFPAAIVYKRWVNSSTTFVQGLAYVFTCPA